MENQEEVLVLQGLPPDMATLSGDDMARLYVSALEIRDWVAAAHIEHEWLRRGVSPSQAEIDVKAKLMQRLDKSQE